MEVICIDPGGKTGVFWYADRFVQRQTNPCIAHWEILGPGKHHLELFRKLNEAYNRSRGELIVIGERFDPRQNPAAVLISKEYIGVIELFAAIHSVPVIWQGPPQKGWATNEKLEKMGMLQRPLVEMKDVNDAIRHFVVYVCTGDLKGNKKLYELKMYLLGRLKES